jgi:hypothetical protein
VYLSANSQKYYQYLSMQGNRNVLREIVVNCADCALQALAAGTLIPPVGGSANNSLSIVIFMKMVI